MDYLAPYGNSDQSVFKKEKKLELESQIDTESTINRKIEKEIC